MGTDFNHTNLFQTENPLMNCYTAFCHVAWDTSKCQRFTIAQHPYYVSDILNFYRIFKVLVKMKLELLKSLFQNLPKEAKLRDSIIYHLTKSNKIADDSQCLIYKR